MHAAKWNPYTCGSAKQATEGGQNQENNDFYPLSVTDFDISDQQRVCSEPQTLHAFECGGCRPTIHCEAWPPSRLRLQSERNSKVRGSAFGPGADATGSYLSS